MIDFLSDEHVANVNGVVQQILGTDKHILARQPECITIGDVLRGLYKRYKEFGGPKHYATDPWKLNYSKSGKMIANDAIHDAIVPAMEVAISLKFMGQQLLRKVMDGKEFHHTEWADRDYFVSNRTPSLIMTEAGREFFETLTLPKTSEYSPAPRRTSKRAGSGAMAPTAVA